jgi:hypothetical protein
MLPVFTPRAPWLGPDLQTLRNMLRPPRTRLARFAGERLVLPMADGSGDQLAGVAAAPAERRAPPVVSDSRPLRRRGQSVHAGERRRAARARPSGRAPQPARRRPSRPLCRFQYHAGRTGDLRDALAALDPSLTADGVLLMGFSLGGNLLLKFLGEQGTAAPIRAAAGVSAPIDLAAAARRILMRRNASTTGTCCGR